MSYFSRTDSDPHRLFYDVINHSSRGIDSIEVEHSEAILAIIDLISLTANNYFSDINRYAKENSPAGIGISDTLQISDAYMHGKDCIVIVMPELNYQHLTK